MSAGVELLNMVKLSVVSSRRDVVCMMTAENKDLRK